MKTTLTIEQSAELIRLGVSKKKASVKTSVDDPSAPDGVRLAVRFTIADLLSLLPKAIEIDGSVQELSMSWYDCYSCWRTNYTLCVKGCDRMEPELIDSLYGLLVQLIQNKYVNPEKL